MTIGLTAALADPCATAISEFESDVYLRNAEIFPNPAKSTLTIDLKQNMKARVFVSDISGRVLLTGNFSEPVFTINLGNFPDGIYLVSITNNVERITRKIAKIH